MKAKISWQDKVHFKSLVGSGHTVVMDGSPDIGGENKGARPTELLLSGVGGCSGIDLVTILEKMRQKISTLDIEVTGIRNDDTPKRFTDIHVNFILTGDIDPEKVEKAVQLSMEKYCSVSLSLNSNITYSYEVNGIKY